jgi:hypothetical protein
VSAPVRIEAIGPRTRRLTAPALISHHGTRALGDMLWLNGNAHTSDHLYQTFYAAIGTDGERVLAEKHGLLPTLFVGPGDTMWAVLTNPYGDRDREVIVQIGEAPGEPYPPFVGTPLWLDAETLVLHNANRFKPNTPDRWMRYDLVSGKRKVIKLAPPTNMQFLRNVEGIHGLARTSHRLFDPAGRVLRERTLALPQLNLEPVELAFDGDSTLFGTDGKTLWWIVVGADGTVARTSLLSGSFYNLWPAQRSTRGIVLRHNGEHGNGWVVVNDGRVVSSVRSVPRGYVDADERPVIELPEATWILSGLEIVGGAIGVVAYAPRGNATDALYVARVD